MARDCGGVCVCGGAEIESERSGEGSEEAQRNAFNLQSRVIERRRQQEEGQ